VDVKAVGFNNCKKTQLVLVPIYGKPKQVVGYAKDGWYKINQCSSFG
jgi:hypothetical protein